MHKSIQKKEFTYGRASFKKDIRQLISQDKQIMNILQQNSWLIDIQSNNTIDESIQYSKWIQILQNMKQCQAQSLKLDSKQNNKAIKYLQNIHFSNLKTLQLNGNNIDNIQSLSLISFQNLTFLNLNCNQITRGESIAKSSISSLDTLLMTDNPIIEANFLAKLKLKDSNIICLCFQLYRDQNVINQSLNFVIKTDSQSIQALWTRSRQRIKQPKIQKMLKLRFNSIQINPPYYQ